MKLNYIYVTFFMISFSLTNVFAQEPGKRCAFDEYQTSVFSANPTLKGILNQTESDFNASNSAKLDANRVITIPVVVNILHRGELEGNGRNIDNERVHEQIRILNEWYSNMNKKGVDSKIRFCLASQDVFGKKTTGIYRYNTLFDTYVPFDEQGNLTAHDYEIKKNTKGSFPFQQYLNIWVADIAEWDSNGTLYGYANFPIPAENQLNIRDGVVINHKSFGLTEDSYAGLGVTAVHEVGHWLGLFHTFQGTSIDDKGTPDDTDDDTFVTQCGENEDDCELINDKVCDTEPVLNPASNQILTDCKGVDCNGDETNAVQNVMDYNNDGCYKFFTAGQVARMRNLLDIYRSSIVNSAAPPVACVTPTEPNGDDTPAENCAPNNKTDNYGFRLRQGGLGFGSNLALDGNTLAVADDGATISLFNLEEDCAVQRTAIITKYDPELLNALPFNQEITYLGSKLAISNDYLIFSGTSKFINSPSGSRNHFFAIYKRDESGQFLIWKLELSKEVEVLELRNNELLVVAGRKVINYVLENNSLSKIQEFELGYSVNSVPSDYTVYNGTYLILSSFRVLKVFKKTNNLWEPEPIGIISGDRYLGGIHLTENNELFVTSNDDNIGKIRHYEIVNNNIITRRIKEDTDFGFGNPNGGDRRFLLRGIKKINKEMLVVSRYGMGSTFHLFNNDEIERIENIPYLDDSYFSAVLAPDSHTNLTESRSFGKTDVLNDKFYVVSNVACSEIFIYNLNDILDGVTQYEEGLDKSICTSPPNSSITRGKTITIGGDSNFVIRNGESLPCNIEFNESDGRKVFQASDEIRILPGTQINQGSSFLARIRGEENCDLSGGAYSKSPLSVIDPYTSKLYIYDDTSLKARILEEEIEVEGIIFSPNPTRGFLGIIAPNDNYINSCNISNIAGVNVLNYDNKYSNQRFDLDLTDFAPGIYLINFNMQDGTTISKKVIKE